MSKAEHINRTVYINDEEIRARSIDISYCAEGQDMITLVFYPKQVVMGEIDRSGSMPSQQVFIET